MPTFSSPPITKTQAVTACRWLKASFGAELKAAVKKSNFTVDHLCGIACQETAYFWLSFIDDLNPVQICAACVLDGSGDYKPEQNPRSAFPRNTAAFRAQYDASDPGFADMLIAEGNASRKIRSMQPVNWLYKGYGLFQYDLQFVKTDKGFFLNKEWHSFAACLDRLMVELDRTWKIHKNHFDAIRAYNGSGVDAHNYAVNATGYAEISASV